jgi:hypothetical protein
MLMQNPVCLSVCSHASHLAHSLWSTFGDGTSTRSLERRQDRQLLCRPLTLVASRPNSLRGFVTSHLQRTQAAWLSRQGGACNPDSHGLHAFPRSLSLKKKTQNRRYNPPSFLLLFLYFSPFPLKFSPFPLDFSPFLLFFSFSS